MLPSYSSIQPARRMTIPRRYIKVVVVDDEYEVRKAARGVLEKRPPIRVIAEATDADYGQIAIELQAPDVAVIEHEMHRVNGMELARRLRLLKLPVKLILLTSHTTEAVVNEALKAGFNGFVSKQHVAVELPRAVLAVSAGRTYIGSPYRRTWPRGARKDTLAIGH